MRMFTSRIPTDHHKRRDVRPIRQFPALLVVALLSACGADDLKLGQVGYVVGAFGGAVSDEPTASLVAGDVLSAGGTATDAAVALYFALAVTYPSAAGLGGGGVCVVHDRTSTTVEAIDFTAGRAKRPPAGGGPGFAIPGNVRGMAALHARYGRLRWSQVVLPAERLARFGNRVSRAFFHEIKRHAAIVKASPGLDRLLRGAGGRPLAEGEDLRQIELAVTLGAIRAKGAGEFHSGVFARRLAEAFEAAGSVVTIEDLRAYSPAWRETLKGSFGNHVVHFAPSSVLGGAIASKLWDTLKEKGAYRGARESAGAVAIVEASAATHKSLGTAGTDAVGAGAGAAIPDHAVTSFATIDQLGGAVACSVTMNAPFGVARVLPGTGVIAGAAPRPGRDGGASLAPMLIANKSTGNSFFAAGASGNAAAPTAMISMSLKLLVDDMKLPEAVAAARFYPRSPGRTVFAEDRASTDATARLAARGFRVVRVPAIGRVNAIWCSGGVPRAKNSCRFAVDKRGFGYAVSAER